VSGFISFGTAVFGVLDAAEGEAGFMLKR